MFARSDSHYREEKSRWNPALSIAGNLALPLANATSKEFFSVYTHYSQLIPRTVVSPLKRSLLQRLAFTATQVVEQEFSGHHVINDSPAELSRALLGHYAGLAHLWAIQCRNWKAFVDDFLCHASMFSTRTGRNAAVRSVKPDLSDLHAGNRAVVLVTLADGTRWYYKPRSGKQEMIWSQLVEAINRASFPLCFKVPRIVSGPGHCWMEAIPRRACHNRSEVTKYAYRGGGLFYLLYRLRGVDFHSDNVVAHGPNPVFIDCETLLHPEPRNSDKVIITDALARIGLLPIADCARAAIQGIRYRTTTMRYCEFASSIALGFLAMHRLLQKKHAWLLNRAVALLQEHDVRYVYRPSICYWEILQRSLAAHLMENCRDRNKFVEVCCQTSPATIRRAEVSALAQADIPLLATKAALPRPAPTSIEVKQCLVSIAGGGRRFSARRVYGC